MAKIDVRVLRRLCSRLELSDAAIGRRLGVTREAIRLARNRIGITGRGRNKGLRVNRKRVLRVMRERGLLVMVQSAPWMPNP